MNFLFPMLFSFVCSESLGIRYEDVISKWVSYEKRRMADRPLGTVPSTFTIRDGIVVGSKHLSSRAIWNPLEMFENDFEGIYCEGVESIEENGERRYLIEGYETALDASGVNYLCLSTAIRPLHIKREGITKVAIGYRGYFDEAQARSLGECLSGILDGAEVCVIPESLCGLVSRTEHIVEDGTLYCMVITMTGRKTVASLYKMEVKDKKRMFSNLFHEYFDGVSDWDIQKIVYDHIEKTLRKYVSSKEGISDTNRNVTFYPRMKDSELFELKIDMRPIYKEINKALRYKSIVESVKIVNGVSVVDCEENVRFVIEAPVFDVREIQRRIEGLVNGGKRLDVIESMKKKIGEAIGEGQEYSVMIRSKFYENPIFDKILGPLSSKDIIKPEDIEKGAARAMRTEYSITDPKVLRVSGDSKSGKAYVDEIRLRKSIREILDKKKGRRLRDIFEEVSDSCVEGEDEIFAEINDLNGIRRAVSKWKEVEAKDAKIKMERDLREKALRDLKETITSTEKLGKSNPEVWNDGLKDEVSKALEHLNIMNSDDKYKKEDIEEVEFDLIIRRKSLFNAYEERMKKEAEEKEKAENENKQEDIVDDGEKEEAGADRDIGEGQEFSFEKKAEL
ncbi:hypothetical protein EHEL_071390 [Encephalitozoon hellem ATCC 50504]|uniref:Uncharacterized protein n=1 Tax=Encephalitozoon hellem TaxID=27973 RepID=A0A9Q9F8G5_ENCHE|nr:uncharacterized protein EHEL_071390 [Encephalitozoon hellem ATCC 50504]AFM98665.1 hypothetical protein EHEL_071390 [Encephalitozoon hellem ATCC 50504]UTX43614.1 hypothetical protein GPU96_07g13750 [Encephalitozoon hellem]|eukprot:XP_003887646.1 hypothetical protein EHEL_071390 [Encephalitozoon hellem ATCC 50504]